MVLPSDGVPEIVPMDPYTTRSPAQRRFVVVLAGIAIVLSISGCLFPAEGDSREDTASGELPMPVEDHVLVIDIKTHKTGPEVSILVRMWGPETRRSRSQLGQILDTDGSSRESDRVGGAYIPDLFTCDDDDCRARVLVAVPEVLIGNTPVEWTARASVGGAASDAFSRSASVELTATPTLRTDLGFPPDWTPPDK